MRNWFKYHFGESVMYFLLAVAIVLAAIGLKLI